MRRIVWFASSLVILSCSLDTKNLTGGGGTGGAIGTGGTTSTGGQRAVGGSPTGGQVGTGGTATGGQIGAGGETGGQIGTGGNATGGQIVGTGGSATGGQIGAGGETGGQIGTGGSATGGQTGTGGDKGTGGSAATGGHDRNRWQQRNRRRDLPAARHELRQCTRDGEGLHLRRDRPMPAVGRELADLRLPSVRQRRHHAERHQGAVHEPGVRRPYLQHRLRGWTGELHGPRRDATGHRPGRCRHRGRNGRRARNVHVQLTSTPPARRKCALRLLGMCGEQDSQIELLTTTSPDKR